MSDDGDCLIKNSSLMASMKSSKGEGLVLKYCVGGSCLLYIEAGPIRTIVCSEMIS